MNKEAIDRNIRAMEASLVTAKAEAEKAKEGNAAAGTRLRKAMQEIKAAAQNVRQAVFGK